jgi:hypothetical protein
MRCNNEKNGGNGESECAQIWSDRINTPKRNEVVAKVYTAEGEKISKRSKGARKAGEEKWNRAGACKPVKIFHRSVSEKVEDREQGVRIAIRQGVKISEKFGIKDRKGAWKFRYETINNGI